MNLAFEYDQAGNQARIETLRRNGVTVWSGERVFVGREVPLQAIEAGAVLMNAVIRGNTTCIGKNSGVGRHGIAAIDNSQIGRSVELGPGSYNECVLLDHVSVRGFAELRGGTVLEEGAELGHNVGLKNSFFGAAVIAGSCISFSDVYVTGGTSRLDHTEIGSGAMHFNFSPKRDKFASLLGDSTGLLRRSEPIFVGGNTGLVAPLLIPFGALIPAGLTVRRWPDGVCFSRESSYLRKSLHTVTFIAALQATIAWYRKVRAPFCDDFELRMCHGALAQLQVHLEWRRTELNRYLARILENKHIVPSPTQFKDAIGTAITIVPQVAPLPPVFREEYEQSRKHNSHQESLQALGPKAVEQAKNWICSITEQMVQPAEAVISSLWPSGSG